MKKPIYDSVRTSNELGAANPKSALFSTWTATLVSFIISVAEALAVMAARDYISYIFTSDAEVAKAVSDLCPFLAVTIILNGVQPVLSGTQILTTLKIKLEKTSYVNPTGLNNFRFGICLQEWLWDVDGRHSWHM